MEEEARRELDRARRLETERLEAELAVRDAAMLRLFTLRQEVLPYVEAMAEARGLIDLNLAPGHPPRLWIDLSSHVVIAPDGRSWRLVQEALEERTIIFESDRLEDFAAFLRKFIAHRVVRRHRALAVAGSEAAEPPAGGESLSTLVMVWLAGLLSGALALLSWLVWLGRIRLP